MYTLTPFEYLDSLMVDYTLIPHSTTFTAQETAESAHIKGAQLAKVIVVGSDQLMSMIVIPASAVLVQQDIAKQLNSPNLTIVPENQFAERFPECELGAMPPFGKLYDMSVYLAKELSDQSSIIFNGGTHNLLIKMRMSDYRAITSPTIISRGYRSGNIAGIGDKVKTGKWHRV